MSTQTMKTERMDASTGRAALVGLLAIQIAIGYEWLISGLTKIVRGGFPSGLAAELQEKSEGTAAWYKSFLDGTVIPNAVPFGYLVEIGELLIGLAMIVAALVWLFRMDSLPRAGRSAVLLVTALSSLAAIVLNVNFHLANGSPHPWLIPRDGFDEGVDLDSLMPLVQTVLLAVSGWLWLEQRRREPVVRRLEAEERRAASGTTRQPTKV